MTSLPGVSVSTVTCGSAVSPNPPRAPSTLLSDQLQPTKQFSHHQVCVCMCVCVLLVRASPAVVLSMWPCKNISYIQVLIIYFFPTPPIKLKLRLLIATHLDQSNYLTNQKQGAVNKFDLTVFIRLFQDSSKVQEDVHFSRVATIFQWINWIWLLHLIQDFQCWATYLSTGGEALSWCCCNLLGKKKDELFRLLAQQELLFKVDIPKCTRESQ
jgi:hypothetical protein